jgi:hypothetical protein
MNILDEYRRNAAECQRMAENAANPADKASWLRLAASWLTMIKNNSNQIFAREEQRATNGDGEAWPGLAQEDSKTSH